MKPFRHAAAAAAALGLLILGAPTDAQATPVVQLDKHQLCQDYEALLQSPNAATSWGAAIGSTVWACPGDIPTGLADSGKAIWNHIFGGPEPADPAVVDHLKRHDKLGNKRIREKAYAYDHDAVKAVATTNKATAGQAEGAAYAVQRAQGDVTAEDTLDTLRAKGDQKTLNRLKGLDLGLLMAQPNFLELMQAALRGGLQEVEMLQVRVDATSEGAITDKWQPDGELYGIIKINGVALWHYTREDFKNISRGEYLEMMPRKVYTVGGKVDVRVHLNEADDMNADDLFAYQKGVDNLAPGEQRWTHWRNNSDGGLLNVGYGVNKIPAPTDSGTEGGDGNVGGGSPCSPSWSCSPGIG